MRRAGWGGGVVWNALRNIYLTGLPEGGSPGPTQASGSTSVAQWGGFLGKLCLRGSGTKDCLMMGGVSRGDRAWGSAPPTLEHSLVSPVILIFENFQKSLTPGRLPLCYYRSYNKLFFFTLGLTFPLTLWQLG